MQALLHAARERRYAALSVIGLLWLVALAGCIDAGDTPGASEDIGARESITEAPDDEVAASRIYTNDVGRVEGTLHVEAFAGYARLRLDLEHSAAVEFRVVAAGELTSGLRLVEGTSNAWDYVHYLEPETSYEVLASWRDDTDALNASLQFATTPLPWKWAEAESAPIAPGGRTWGSPLGFFLRDAMFENVYALMAGHGVEDGQEIRITINANTVMVGVVVDRRESETGGDWALVRLRPEILELANPQVTYWTGPGPIAEAGDAQPGDTVCWYGQGQPFSFHDATQHRCGTVQSFTDETATPAGEYVQFWGAVWQGDSGAPLIHYESGKALGMQLAGIPGVWGAAATMCTVMHWLGAAGWDLALLEAQFDPPPADPHAPVPGSGAAMQCWRS